MITIQGIVFPEFPDRGRDWHIHSRMKPWFLAAILGTVVDNAFNRYRLQNLHVLSPGEGGEVKAQSVRRAQQLY